MIVSIGFGNLVSAERVIAVVSPDAAPVRRLVQNARERERCVDATSGRKTKSVLVMDPDYIVLSALAPETLARRFQGNGQAGETEETGGQEA